MARTPDELRRAVAERWRDGATSQAMRLEFGLTPGSLAGILHRLKGLGIIQARRRSNGPKRPVTMAVQATVEHDAETLDPALCRDDLERQVVELWNARHQAQAIAEHLGMSSSRAVQGMIARIMNRRDGVVWKREYKPRMSRRKAPLPDGEIDLGNAKMPPRRTDNVVPYPVGPIPTPKGCCWPMWGDRERPTQVFCGAAVSTRSYCAHHYRRAYARAERATSDLVAAE